MHTVWELQQKQGMPLDLKIRMTEARIRQFYEHYDGMVYISFSGGKDSTVLLDIARRLYPDIPAVFVNTGMEYPEVRKFAQSKSNVITLKPKLTIKEVLSKYGYPVISKETSKYIHEIRTTKSEHLLNIRLGKGVGALPKKWRYLLNAPFKISDECCKVMKKAPLKKYQRETGRMPIVGTMAEESRLRLTSWLQTGCNSFDGDKGMSRPLSFWTEQDILKYIKEKGIAIASVYGEIAEEADLLGKITLSTTGFKRTGCTFCLFGCHFESQPNRIQSLAKTHPKIYNFCINELHFGEVMEFLKIPFKPLEGE